MGNAKKKPAAPKKKNSSSEFPWRATLHVMFGVILVSSAVFIFRFCQEYVDRRLAFPTRPVKVVLANRPVWMSDFLAEQIIKTAQPMGLHSAFDHQLLVDTVNALKSDPWIKSVKQVRREYAQTPGDTLEIDCDYRAPVALVKWGQYYWLVDGEGVKLPEQYTARQLPQIMFGNDGKVNVRIIDGVLHAPTESGRTWPGNDLAGGLELARLLAERDSAEEIRVIDVTNYGGRNDPREAQIVLITQYGTQVRWGRPPSAKDAFIEVPASVKLAAMDRIYEQKNRVDAGQPWVDIRFDQVTCPRPQPAADVESSADTSDK
jgi:hypothetical protein